MLSRLPRYSCAQGGWAARAFGASAAATAELAAAHQSTAYIRGAAPDSLIRSRAACVLGDGTAWSQASLLCPASTRGLWAGLADAPDADAADAAVQVALAAGVNCWYLPAVTGAALRDASSAAAMPAVQLGNSRAQHVVCAPVLVGGQDGITPRELSSAMQQASVWASQCGDGSIDVLSLQLNAEPSAAPQWSVRELVQELNALACARPGLELELDVTGWPVDSLADAGAEPGSVAALLQLMSSEAPAARQALSGLLSHISIIQNQPILGHGSQRSLLQLCRQDQLMLHALAPLDAVHDTRIWRAADTAPYTRSDDEASDVRILSQALANIMRIEDQYDELSAELLISQRLASARRPRLGRVIAVNVFLADCIAQWLPTQTHQLQQEVQAVLADHSEVPELERWRKAYSSLMGILQHEMGLQLTSRHAERCSAARAWLQRAVPCYAAEPCASLPLSSQAVSMVLAAGAHSALVGLPSAWLAAGQPGADTLASPRVLSSIPQTAARAGLASARHDLLPSIIPARPRVTFTDAAPAQELAAEAQADSSAFGVEAPPPPLPAAGPTTTDATAPAAAPRAWQSHADKLRAAAAAAASAKQQKAKRP